MPMRRPPQLDRQQTVEWLAGSGIRQHDVREVVAEASAVGLPRETAKLAPDVNGLRDDRGSIDRTRLQRHRKSLQLLARRLVRKIARGVIADMRSGEHRQQLGLDRGARRVELKARASIKSMTRRGVVGLRMT